jgi:hypothetical protein
MAVVRRRFREAVLGAENYADNYVEDAIRPIRWMQRCHIRRT